MPLFPKGSVDTSKGRGKKTHESNSGCAFISIFATPYKIPDGLSVECRQYKPYGRFTHNPSSQ